MWATRPCSAGSSTGPGMPAHRVQWWPLAALLITPLAIAVVDTPIGIIALSAAAVLAGVFVAVRWRLVHAAARIEEIIEAELAPREDRPPPRCRNSVGPAEHGPLGNAVGMMVVPRSSAMQPWSAAIDRSDAVFVYIPGVATRSTMEPHVSHTTDETGPGDPERSRTHGCDSAQAATAARMTLAELAVLGRATSKLFQQTNEHLHRLHHPTAGPAHHTRPAPKPVVGRHRRATAGSSSSAPYQGRQVRARGQRPARLPRASWCTAATPATHSFRPPLPLIACRLLWLGSELSRARQSPGTTAARCSQRVFLTGRGV